MKIQNLDPIRPSVDTSKNPKEDRKEATPEKVSSDRVIKRDRPNRPIGGPSDDEIRKKIWEKRGGIESPMFSGPAIAKDRPKTFPLDDAIDAVALAKEVSNKLDMQAISTKAALDSSNSLLKT